MSEDETSACEATLCRCRCDLPAGHGTDHTCGCGGAWRWDADGDADIIRHPGGLDLDDPNLPSVPSGFNPKQFERALRIYGDPFIAAICASPPRRAESGPIEYRR